MIAICCAGGSFCFVVGVLRFVASRVGVNVSVIAVVVVGDPLVVFVAFVGRKDADAIVEIDVGGAGTDVVVDVVVDDALGVVSVVGLGSNAGIVFSVDDGGFDADAGGVGVAIVSFNGVAVAIVLIKVVVCFNWRDNVGVVEITGC